MLTLVVRRWTLGTLARQEIETSTRMLRYYLLGGLSALPPQAPHGRAAAQHERRGLAGLWAGRGWHVLAVIAESLMIAAVTVSLMFVQPVPTLVLIVYFGAGCVVLPEDVSRRATSLPTSSCSSPRSSIYIAGTQALGGVKDITLRGSQELLPDPLPDQPHHLGKRRSGSGCSSPELPKYVMEILFIGGVGLMTVVVYLSDPSAVRL